MKALEGHYKLAPVRFELFAYIDLLFNSLEITLSKKQDRLIINSLQQKSYTLFPVENNLFRKEDRVRASHIFYQQNGKIVYSDGLATYEKVSPIYLGSLLSGFALGVLGLFAILIKGVYTMIKQKRIFIHHAILFPVLSILLLVVPIPFFFIQSFIQLGDLTVGNLLLTTVTGILPFSLLYGIVVSYKNKNGWNMDLLAMILFLQWITVLAFWGLIPFKLWEI